MSLLRPARKLFFKDGALPEVLTAFVTHRCNADCSFCFFSDSLNKPVDELSAAEWRAVAKSLGPFGLLIMTGGEPFLRAELPDIAAGFALEGAENIAVPTNGYQTDRIAPLVEAALDATPLKTLCVSLSIDALGAEHDALRKVPGGFSRLLETAAVLRELRARRPGRLLLHTATVFSAVNQRGVEATLKEIERLVEPDSMGLTLVRPPFSGPHQDGLDVAQYRRLNTALAERSVSSRYHPIGAKLHRAKTQRVAAEQLDGLYVSPCYAGTLSAVVLADGRMPLCEKRGELLGSLRDFDCDLAALWRSPQARERAARQQAERCACGHECFVTPSILFNPRELAKALLA